MCKSGLKRAHQRTLGFKPTLWSNTIWNDIRYPKIRVYIYSTGDDLRMLEVLEILITFASENNGCVYLITLYQ